MKRNAGFLRNVALLLFAAILIPVLTVSAVGSTKYDYSYPSANAVAEIYPEEFLAAHLPEIELSEEEIAFLREDYGALVRYNSFIPSYCVETELLGGVLTLTADKYDYVAENGTIVIWKPFEAELCGEVKSFGDAPYTLSFEGVGEDASDKVTVRYSASFEIREETLNELINYSYENALILKEHIINKREEYERYLFDLDKYNEYLAALALYNEYLSEYRLYEEALAEYNEYLSDVAEYELHLEKYRDYVIARDKYYRDLAKYTEYLAYAEQNQDKIDAYESYQEKYETVLAQLDIIKRTKTPISVTGAPGRTVYGAIMGDTVTAVIDRKGDIVSVLKADGAVVDLAGEATENLRVLMTEFFEKRSVEAQYNYYITNYEAFRDNFVNLLRALENLYNVSGVRGTMIEQGKYEKYIVLVAQLYYIANALTDEPILSIDGTYYYDGDFVIGMKYKEDYKRISPEAALENQFFLGDTASAEPLEGGFPIEPEKPDFLTVEEPTMPEPVSKPILPKEVSEPTHPVPVLKPDEVLRPARVEEYVPSDATLALVLALDEGKLSRREDYTGGSIRLEEKLSLSKSVKRSPTVTVNYYDKEYDSSEEHFLLYSVTVDRGTAADYLGARPSRAEDADYVYTHSGWTDKDGNDFNCLSVNGSVDLYPKFHRAEQIFDTYWVSEDGTVLNDNPGIPALPESDYYEYDYGWGEPVLDLEEGTKTFRLEYLTNRPLVKTDFGTVKVYKDAASFTFTQGSGINEINISTLLERAAGEYGITMRTQSGATVSFSIAETLNLKRAGVETLSVKSDKRLTVVLYNSDGETVEIPASFTFSVPYESADPSHLVVSYTEDGERKVVRHKLLEDGLAVFSAETGVVYNLRTEYSLTAAPLLDGVEIKLTRGEAEAGDTVGVTVTAPEGISIERVYVRQNIPDGEELEVINSSFVMPSYDIIVGVEYKKLTYTVTFISDGRALTSVKYNYGDTLVVPADPSKASNDKFSFVFKGWSPEIAETVTGSITYSAVYEAEPLPPKDNSNDKMTPTVLKLVLLAVVGLCCFGFIVIPSAVINLVLKSRRKKHVFKLEK